jgi:hypothetical protein
MEVQPSESDAFRRMSTKPAKSVCNGCSMTLKAPNLEILEIAEEVHLQFCPARDQKSVVRSAT